MATNNIRIMYLRGRHNHAVGCIALQVNKENCMITYQVSVQNPQDRFNRKLARQIAIGRLIENPLTILASDNDLAGTRNITIAVMESIANNIFQLPTRAVKCAKAWLNAPTWKIEAKKTAKVISNENLEYVPNATITPCTCNICENRLGEELSSQTCEDYPLIDNYFDPCYSETF
jgi:hypothetical protein